VLPECIDNVLTRASSFIEVDCREGMRRADSRKYLGRRDTLKGQTEGASGGDDGYGQTTIKVRGVSNTVTFSYVSYVWPIQVTVYLCK